MKIVKLTAENIKRLHAIEIEPDANVVLVTGRNGQGKTSVLDSIWYALGGKDALPPRPIRDGEDSASVQLDLGDLVVTRSWTANDKSYLKVTNRDGAKYGSPQAILDALVGRLTFDPLAFSRMAGREQRSIMLSLGKLDYDLGAHDQRKRVLEEMRRDLGRDLKSAEALLSSLPSPQPDAPDDEVPLSEATAILERELAKEQRIAAYGKRLADARSRYAECVVRAAQAIDNVERANAALSDAESAQHAASDEVARIKDEPQEVCHVANARTMVDSIDQRNAQARAKRAKAAAAESVERIRKQWQMAQDDLHDLDEARGAALAAAEFPVAGLGITDDGITFDGVPFEQLADSQKLRVSMAMAMASNPMLHVIRVTDGSLLDSDSMAIVEEMASERDYQVWIERVDESGEVGVVIENGAVKNKKAVKA